MKRIVNPRSLAPTPYKPVFKPDSQTDSTVYGMQTSLLQGLKTANGPTGQPLPYEPHRSPVAYGQPLNAGVH